MGKVGLLLLSVSLCLPALAAPGDDARARLAEQRRRTERVLRRIVASDDPHGAATRRLEEEELFLFRLRGSAVPVTPASPRADRAMRFALLRSALLVSANPEVVRAAFQSLARARRQGQSPIVVPPELLADGFPDLEPDAYRPEVLALVEAWRRGDPRGRSALAFVLEAGLDPLDAMALRELLRLGNRPGAPEWIGEVVISFLRGEDVFAAVFPRVGAGGFRRRVEEPVAAFVATSPALATALYSAHDGWQFGLERREDAPSLPWAEGENEEQRLLRWRDLRAGAIAAIARRAERRPDDELALSILWRLARQRRLPAPENDVFGELQPRGHGATTERFLAGDAPWALARLVRPGLPGDVRAAALALLVFFGTLTDDAFEPVWRSAVFDPDPSFRSFARRCLLLGQIRIENESRGRLSWAEAEARKAENAAGIVFGTPSLPVPPPPRSRKILELALAIAPEGLGDGDDAWRIETTLAAQRLEVLRHADSSDPAIRAWAESLRFRERPPRPDEVPGLLARLERETDPEPRRELLDALRRFRESPDATVLLTTPGPGGDGLRRLLVTRALAEARPERIFDEIPREPALWLPLLDDGDEAVRVFSASVLRSVGRPAATTAVQRAYVRGRLPDDWESRHPIVRWGGVDRLEKSSDPRRRREAYDLAFDRLDEAALRAVVLRYADERDLAVRKQVERRFAASGWRTWALEQLREDAPEGRFRDALAALVLETYPTDEEARAAVRSATEIFGDTTLELERERCAALLRRHGAG